MSVGGALVAALAMGLNAGAHKGRPYSRCNGVTIYVTDL
jgi:hypothetical protein